MKNLKRILIILGILFGVAGLTTISVQTTNKIIENRKAKKLEEAKEKKIKEEKENKKERQKIAVWVVQNIEGPEPIRNIKVGSINHGGFMGTGGKSVNVKLNNDNNNCFLFLLRDNEPMTDTAVISEKNKFKFRQKTNKNLNLKGIKVEEWK